MSSIFRISGLIVIFALAVSSGPHQSGIQEATKSPLVGVVPVSESNGVRRRSSYDLWNRNTATRMLVDAQRFYFVDQNHGWMVGWDGKIAQSTDGGRTWAAQNSNTKVRLRDVWFANRTVGWAVGSGDSYDQPTTDVLLHTTDGGKRWIKIKPPVPSLRCKLTFFDQDNGWLVGYDQTARQGLLAHTSDGGSSWKVSQLSLKAEGFTDSIVNALSFTSPGEGWAVSDRAVYHTEDAGLTWQSQYLKPFESLPDYDFRWVQFIDNHTGWAVGKTTGCRGFVTGMVRTTDGGNTWQESSPEAVFNDVRFLDSQFGVAIGYRFLDPTISINKLSPVGVILTTMDGGSTWKQVYTADSPVTDLTIALDGFGFALTERLDTLTCKAE